MVTILDASMPPNSVRNQATNTQQLPLDLSFSMPHASLHFVFAKLRPSRGEGWIYYKKVKLYNTSPDKLFRQKLLNYSFTKVLYNFFGISIQKEMLEEFLDYPDSLTPDKFEEFFLCKKSRYSFIACFHEDKGILLDEVPNFWQP